MLNRDQYNRIKTIITLYQIATFIALMLFAGSFFEQVKPSDKVKEDVQAKNPEYVKGINEKK